MMTFARRGSVTLVTLVRLSLLLVLCNGMASHAAEPPAVVEGGDPDSRWAALQNHYFPDAEILPGEGIIGLEAPKRAHDAAVVPVAVTSLDQSRRVKQVHLIVDQNPLPLAGVFNFRDEAAGWERLETRIRINEYTHVRAIAQLDDDSLVMVSRFVKAAGGCSAPAMADLQAAMARAGKMKLLLEEASAASRHQVEGSSPLINGLASASIKISHPNNSGMQFDQVSRNYIPAFYVKEITASLDGRPLIDIETNFSMSENPAVALIFPNEDGPAELVVKAVDSKGNEYEHSAAIATGS